MNAWSKRLIVSLSFAALLGGLIGCGSKEPEGPATDPAKSKEFASPPVNTGGAPGGGTGTTTKPTTQ
jgi:hypothetical protein